MSAEEERAACGNCRFGLPLAAWRVRPRKSKWEGRARDVIECTRMPMFVLKLSDERCGEHLKQEKPDER